MMVPLLASSFAPGAWFGNAPTLIGAALLAFWGLARWRGTPAVDRMPYRVLGSVFLVISLSLWLGFDRGPAAAAEGHGGGFGDYFANCFQTPAMRTFGVILVGLATLISIPLATDWLFLPLFLRYRAARGLATAPVIGAVGGYEIRGAYAHTEHGAEQIETGGDSEADADDADDTGVATLDGDEDAADARDDASRRAVMLGAAAIEEDEEVSDDVTGEDDVSAVGAPVESGADTEAAQEDADDGIPWYARRRRSSAVPPAPADVVYEEADDADDAREPDVEDDLDDEDASASDSTPDESVARGTNGSYASSERATDEDIEDDAFDDEDFDEPAARSAVEPRDPVESVESDESDEAEVDAAIDEEAIEAAAPDASGASRGSDSSDPSAQGIGAAAPVPAFSAGDDELDDALSFMDDDDAIPASDRASAASSAEDTEREGAEDPTESASRSDTRLDAGLDDAFAFADEPVAQHPETPAAQEIPQVREGDVDDALSFLDEDSPSANAPASGAAPEREPAVAHAAPRTEDDLLFQKAGDAVVSAGKASISFLQKTLGIGYFQAAKLLDRLEREKVIGPYTGGVNRDVLLDMGEWSKVR